MVTLILIGGLVRLRLFKFNAPIVRPLSVKIKTFKNPEYLFHVLLWLFFIGERWINHYPKAENFFTYGIIHTLYLLLTFITPVYINAFVLIPTFLQKRKWLHYLAFLAGMIFIVNLSRGLFTVISFEISKFEYDFYQTFLKWAFRDYVSLDKFVFSGTSWILWSSFGYRLVKDWIIHERVKSRLESEKLSMELAFLKAQVNPHFLFNTLNNLYALSLEEKAQRTSDAVTKMGALMRYNLHEAQAERILLTKELDYLDQYIELQKLRIVKHSQICFYTNAQPGNCAAKIAPMILLPFIENAFKYGVSTVGETRIEAEAVLENNTLKLTVKNALHRNPERDESGIGLKNVRNRLELIYGGKYSLKQTKDDEEYSIELELDLTE